MLTSLLGIGGGIIFVPLLFHTFHNRGVTDPLLSQMVIVNSICLTLFSTTSSLVFRINELKANLKTSLHLGLAASFASILSFHTVVMYGFVNKNMVAVLLTVAIGVTMVRNYLFKKNKNQIKELYKINTTKITITGLLSGIFASLSGLGGGVVVVPALTEIFRTDIRLAQTTSLMVVTISSLALTLSNIISESKACNDQSGLYDWGLILPIVAGILAGAPIGNKVYKRLPEWLLKALFLALLAYIAYVNFRLLTS